MMENCIVFIIIKPLRQCNQRDLLEELFFTLHYLDFLATRSCKQCGWCSFSSRSVNNQGIVSLTKSCCIKGVLRMSFFSSLNSILVGNSLSLVQCSQEVLGQVRLGIIKSFIMFNARRSEYMFIVVMHLIICFQCVFIFVLQEMQINMKFLRFFLSQCHKFFLYSET